MLSPPALQVQPEAVVLQGALQLMGVSGHAAADEHVHLGDTVPVHWHEPGPPFSTHGQVLVSSGKLHAAPQTGGIAGHPVPPHTPEQAHLPPLHAQSFAQTSLHTCPALGHWRPFATTWGQPDEQVWSHAHLPEVQAHLVEQFGPIG